METDKLFRDCPVCRGSLTKPAPIALLGQGDRRWVGWEFECRHCGNFSLDQLELGHLLNYLNPPNAPGVRATALQLARHRAVLAHALRRMQGSVPKLVLTDGMTLRILKEDRLPGLAEQRDNLLRWFGENIEMSTAGGISWEVLGARIGSESPGAFMLLLESMLAEESMVGSLGLGATAKLSLTYRGLERLEQLDRAEPSGYNAFMAMQFNDTALDRIVNDYFRPAVTEAGFKLLRLDDKPEAGLIDAHLRNEIRNCRFLIADLSHGNAGSYWEAGYAEGLGKPVIYTCEKSVFEGSGAAVGKPHFDTNHHLTVVWDTENPRPAADRLRETIRFTIPEARQRT